MNRILFLALAIGLLAGCKSELTLSVKMSQLLSPALTSSQAQLLLTVKDCVEIQKTKTVEPSKNLLDIQARMLRILPKIKYSECYTNDKGLSIARFYLPVAIGQFDPDKADYVDSMLYLLGGQLDDRLAFKSAPLRVALSEDTKARLIREQKNSLDLLLTSDLKITIYIENDTGNDINNMMASGVYINSKAFSQLQRFQLPAKQRISLRLSDILVDSLRDSEQNGLPILNFVSESDDGLLMPNN